MFRPRRDTVPGGAVPSTRLRRALPPPPPPPLVVLVLTVALVLVLTACSSGPTSPEPAAATGPLEVTFDAPSSEEVRAFEARVLEQAAEGSEAVRRALGDPSEQMHPSCLAVAGLAVTVGDTWTAALDPAALEASLAIERMRAEWWSRVPPELSSAMAAADAIAADTAEQLSALRRSSRDPIGPATVRAVAEPALARIGEAYAPVEAWITSNCRL
jgi:hypothetical protein